MGASGIVPSRQAPRRSLCIKRVIRHRADFGVLSRRHGLGGTCSLALKTLGKMVSVRRSRPRPSGVLVIAMSPSLVLLRYLRADLALDNCSYRE